MGQLQMRCISLLALTTVASLFAEARSLHDELAHVRQDTKISIKKRAADELPIFPPKMNFTLDIYGGPINLNLVKIEQQFNDIHYTDENGVIDTDVTDYMALYKDIDNLATMVVECRPPKNCTLVGSFLMGDDKLIVSPSIENPEFHRVRRAAAKSDRKAKKKSKDEISQGGDLHSKYANYPKTAQMNGAEEKKSRQKRSGSFPNCEIVEVFAYADESLYNLWLGLSNGNAQTAEGNMLAYFITLFAEADLRYASFPTTSPCGRCIRIYLKGLHIDKLSQSSWTWWYYNQYQYYYTQTINNKVYLDTAYALVNCAQRQIYDRYNYGNSYVNYADHVLCFTGYDLTTSLEYYGNALAVDTGGSYLNTICSSHYDNSASVVEDNHDATDWSIAHEIMHALGSDNDANIGCDPNDRYISSDTHTIPTDPAKLLNSWQVSPCAATIICNKLAALPVGCCLRQTSGTVTDFNTKLGGPMFGATHSPDDECVWRFGAGSTECGPTYPTNMCTVGISCIVNGACTGSTRISSGTVCGHGMECYRGECKCVTGTALGGTCCQTSSCGTEHAVCDSTSKLCTCGPGYYDNNGNTAGGSCLPVLGLCAACTSNEQCGDFSCINGKCECQTNFILNKCGVCTAAPTTTGSACTSNTFCDSGVCSNGFCGCPAGKIQVGNNCYDGTLGSDCFTGSACTCTAPNTKCDPTTSKCVCKDGLIVVGGICVGNQLGHPCTATSGCTAPNICSPSGSCVCNYAGGFIIDTNGNCVGTQLGQPCSSKSCVAIPYMVCDTTCKCDTAKGYKLEGTQCVGTLPGQVCSATSCNPPFTCLGGICKCPTTHLEVNGQCVIGNVGDQCIDKCTQDRALCVDGQCKCNPETLLVSGNCLSTLCGTCTTNTDCTGSNVVCDDVSKKCSCAANFISNGCGACEPAPNSIGSVCTSHTFCASGNCVGGKCVCPANNVQVGLTCYDGNVGSTCLTGSTCTCTAPNTECVGGTCQCTTGLTASGGVCVGTKPGNPCTTTCDAGFVCTNNICQCPTGSTLINSQCVTGKLNEVCNTGTCTDTNTVCLEGTCKCKAGTSLSGGKCLSHLCEPCAITSDCIAPNMVCTAGKCACAANFISNGCDTCVAAPTSIGSPCTENSGCASANCVSNKCVCEAGKIQVGLTCYDGNVGSTCLTGSTCTCTAPNTECVGGTCQCTAGLTASGGVCVGTKPGNPCTTTCDPGFVCTNNICQCPTGSTLIQSQCVTGKLNEVCTAGTCTDTNTECIEGTCKCKAGTSLSGGKCLSHLCEPCVIPSDCIGSNMVCTAGKCACAANFISNGCDTCVAAPTSIGSPCTENSGCASANCVSNKCVCEAGKIQVGLTCYDGTLGSTCLTGSTCTCTAPNTECVGGTCQCKTGLTASGGVCVGSDPGEPCVANGCTAPYVCTGGICTCDFAAGYLQQTANNCVGTKLGQTCSGTSCTAIPYMICDTTCKCDTANGYVQEGTVCVGTRAGQTCSATSCTAPLVCTAGTCQCPTGQTLVNGQCESGNLGSGCVQCSCTQKNTVCVSGTCQCKPGTTDIAGNCVSLLGQSCDATVGCSANMQCTNTGDQYCDTVCVCNDGYITNNPDGDFSCGGDCVQQSTYGGTCNPTINNICFPEDTVYCPEGTCVCKLDYTYDATSMTCERTKKQLNEACTCSDLCVPEESVHCDAATQTCQCRPGWKANTANPPVCEKFILIGDPCQASGSCAGYPAVKCVVNKDSGTKVCECNKGFVPDPTKSFCVPENR